MFGRREMISIGVAGVLVGAMVGPTAPGVRARPTREPRAGAVPFTAAPPQTVELTLPFDGIWGVIQGIASDLTHVGYATFALDFVPAERLTAALPPIRNRLRDFPCFGRDVLSAADGIVVWAQDGAADDVPDSPGSARVGRRPGQRRRGSKRDPGNFVIVQHADGEYTEYRHLQSRSVQVAVGEGVRRGQTLGRCGNSGNAGTPHLHVGLLGSVDPIATRPMRFSRYEVQGPAGVWSSGDGVPRAGQILRSMVKPAPAKPVL